MRWESGRRSSNVEDRRGMRMPGGFKGGGIGIILVALVAMYFGIDPSVILNQGGQMEGDQPATSTEYTPTAEENQLADFVAVVLADTEDTWHQQFQQLGSGYSEPTLVLFSGAVQSACGFAQAAMGPVLLPRRPEGLYRPQLLPGPERKNERPRRLRPGLCDRP